MFFGRFVLGLRVWASWLAGATRMHWRSFALWNALGGITWAIGVGLIAYFLGSSAGNALEAFGIYGLVAVADRDRRRPAAASAPRRPRATHTERLGRVTQQALQGAIRSHMSASRLSSLSEKREKKCSLTTARWVPRAASRRSRPASVRHA